MSSKMKKNIYYFTLEGFDGRIKLTTATKALAKKLLPQCGNEGICYKRKAGDAGYKKFAFMW